MYEAHISDNFNIDGVYIYISDKQGHDRKILHLSSEGFGQSWEHVDPAVAFTNPTMRLNGEAARALLVALTRHYDGAPDVHQVRNDLLHERQRRELLEDKALELLDRTVKR